MFEMRSYQKRKTERQLQETATERQLREPIVLSCPNCSKNVEVKHEFCKNCGSTLPRRKIPSKKGLQKLQVAFSFSLALTILSIFLLFLSYFSNTFDFYYMDVSGFFIVSTVISATIMILFLVLLIRQNQLFSQVKKEKIDLQD